MDEEQFRVEGWRFRYEYEVQHPHVLGCLQETRKIQIWEPSIDGLREYSRLRQSRKGERREAWKAREEEEESFREYVDGLDDAKPNWKSRKEGTEG